MQTRIQNVNMKLVLNNGSAPLLRCALLKIPIVDTLEDLSLIYGVILVSKFCFCRSKSSYPSPWITLLYTFDFALKGITEESNVDNTKE